MDTTQVINGIYQTLDGVGWVLLFLGWLLYWLKQLDAARRKDISSFWSVPLNDFIRANAFEVPISVVSCLAIAILANEIPPSIMDLKGRLSILIAGYANSSIITGLLSYRKKPE